MSMMTVPISMYGWMHSNKGLSVKNAKIKTIDVFILVVGKYFLQRTLKTLTIKEKPTN